MGRSRVKLVDVAAAANVSPTTVSFVINGVGTNIPDATRERVWRAVRDLKYRPNATARALATGTTNRIGIVLNSPEFFASRDLYFSPLLGGMLTAGPEVNYNLILHAARYPDWQALHTDILSGHADAVVLIGRPSEDQLTQALLDAGFPTVCVAFHRDHANCISVDCDNVVGGDLAVSHLLEQGYAHILLAYPGDNHSWGRERRLGAVAALERAGRSGDDLTLFDWHEAPGDGEDIRLLVQHIVNSRPRINGVFVADEFHGFVLAEALTAAGVRIPEDLGIVSFNSTQMSAGAPIPVTSVWQPVEQIGSEAVRLAARCVRGGVEATPSVRFPVRLDVRRSTMRG